MKVLILGVDGYLGWPLALHLTARGHEVAGTDCFLRRVWVAKMGSQSATPIPEVQDRLSLFPRGLKFEEGDITDWVLCKWAIESFKPDAIVHLAEQPSAPYSMISRDHCVGTHVNNMVGTLHVLYAIKEFAPNAHLVKLGSMGEYGTPNIDIPEGFFEIEYRGRKDRLPFPKQANSWYHLTKVHDTNNIAFASRIWGLRATDIMQGVVFGVEIPAMDGNQKMLTRFDYDECFGTAINRFCAQAVVGQPLTLYGKGHQKRGFLPLKDSIQCITIAVEHPPKTGEYRVFNQFENVYDLTELARMVQRLAGGLGMDPKIQNIPNPRMEMEEHYYNPDRQHLLDLGYQPTENIEWDIEDLLGTLQRYRKRIRPEVLAPRITWAGEGEIHGPKDY